MDRLFAPLLMAAVAAPMSAQPSHANLKTPAALELFERDWVLMNWALKYFDANRDILIEPDEAMVAAAAFRKLADKDGDGRVTPEEYQAARAGILSHD
jgi:hypothetical protein